MITHDITAKFGVDLNAIKIAKLDGNAIAVSGIRSKFIGTSKNISEEIVKEYRTCNFNKNAQLLSVDVKYDRASQDTIDKQAKEYERDFQTKLSEGLELEFMNDAVVQLAQNFISVMFAPLYKNITFTDAEQPDALPFMKYLERELKDNRDRKNELLNSNENLIMVNEQLETEAAKVEDFGTEAE